jgi:hypothetical protein
MMNMSNTVEVGLRGGAGLPARSVERGARLGSLVSSAGKLVAVCMNCGDPAYWEEPERDERDDG